MCIGLTSREFNNIYSNSNRIQYTYNMLKSHVRTSPSSTWSNHIRGGVSNILTRLFPPQKSGMNNTGTAVTSRVERDLSYESYGIYDNINRVYIDDCYTVDELRAYIRSPHNYDLYSVCRSDNNSTRGGSRDSSRVAYV